ncbi:hypothetical protein ETAR_06670 [Edwardsiella tarda]|nr:hypothetical protein GBS0709_06640 [Edwardsiella tarda]
MNSNLMLAQVFVTTGNLFHTWRQIWGDITSDERAVNGSGIGRTRPEGGQEGV